MSPDLYVLEVISKYHQHASHALKTGQKFQDVIRGWTRRYLVGIGFTGSYAKGTRIKGGTDIDVLVSVGPRTPGRMKQIFDNLYVFTRAKGLSPRRRCISVAVKYDGHIIDVIPARLQWGAANDHEVYIAPSDESAVVNFEKQVKYVRDSGWLKEIEAAKIWRNLRNLDFPSYCLELAVLRALKGAVQNRHLANLFTALKFFRDELPRTPMMDPSNVHHDTSICMDRGAKAEISLAAKLSLEESDLRKIIW